MLALSIIKLNGADLAVETSKNGSLNKELGDDIWRSILERVEELKTLVALKKVNASFRKLVDNYMHEAWDKWNSWKNQVPLYPPEVSGYSTAAKLVDKLLFERLVCVRGPQEISLGSFEREGRR